MLDLWQVIDTQTETTSELNRRLNVKLADPLEELIANLVNWCPSRVPVKYSSLIKILVGLSPKQPLFWTLISPDLHTSSFCSASSWQRRCVGMPADANDRLMPTPSSLYKRNTQIASINTFCWLHPSSIMVHLQMRRGGALMAYKACPLYLGCNVCSICYFKIIALQHRCELSLSWSKWTEWQKCTAVINTQFHCLCFILTVWSKLQAGVSLNSFKHRFGTIVPYLPKRSHLNFALTSQS